MNSKTFFEKNRFIILLLLIVFIFRLPSLFEPYWYGDEGVYLALGLAIRKGFLLYRDIFDNKPPLIYLLAALANGTMFWFRLFLDISILTTICFFYRLSQNFLSSEKTARLATIILSLLTTIRLIEGNVANAEIFILLPTILTLYLLSPVLLFEERKSFSLPLIFLVGILFGLGCLFKIPAVFDFLTVIVFLALFKKRKIFVNLGKPELILISGYLLPILATGFFFWLRGSFVSFLNACFFQTVGYLSSWETGSHVFSLISLLKSDFGVRSLVALLLTFALWLKKNRLSLPLVFVIIWFVFSLYAATLAGRPYPHYLIQVVPALSLMIGFVFSKAVKSFYPLFSITILLLAFVVLRYHFWAYPTWSYYRNFVEFVVGKESKLTYLSYFSPKLPQIYNLAEFIASISKPNDKVFIWADEPYLYPLSQRLPATRFVVAYHIIDLDQFSPVITQISQVKPSLIVINQDVGKFPDLERIVQREYFNIYSLDNFLVFRRRNL